MKKHLREIKSTKNEIENFINKIKKYSNVGLKEMPAEDIVAIGNHLGKILKDENVKTTQIRKFLDAVRKIQVNFNKDSIIMLKPKLAYTAGRHRNLKSFMQVLDPAIEATKDAESFKKLVQLIEAVVAYHRFYGGRDN